MKRFSGLILDINPVNPFILKILVQTVFLAFFAALRENLNYQERFCQDSKYCADQMSL
jgi:hypothetical protein